MPLRLDLNPFYINEVGVYTFFIDSRKLLNVNILKNAKVKENIFFVHRL